MRRTWIGLLATTALVVGACGGDDSESDGADGATAPAAADDTTAPTTTPSTSAGTADTAPSTEATETSTAGTPASSDAPAADCRTLPETEDVVLSVSRPILAFSPVLLAMQNGAFEEANLNVTVEPLSAAEALAPLSQGRIDASLTSYGAGYFNAVDSGIDLRWVMPGYSANPDSFEGYWARTEVVGTGDEPDLSALEGATVGSPTAGTGAGGLVMAKALEPEGLSLADVTFTQLSGTDALLALENGAVQATWLSDPVWTQALDNPDLRFVTSYAPGINGSGLVVGPGLLDRPEVLETFLRVVSQTIEEDLGPDFLEDPEVVAHLAVALDTTPEQLAEALPLDFDADLSLDGGAEFLDELQALMQEQDVLEYDALIPGVELIDESFAQAAVACR